MKKLLAILASFSLLTTSGVSVVACSEKPEYANDKDLFSLQNKDQVLEIDAKGSQVSDFSFDLSYVSNSPTTGDSTNVQIQSATIAQEAENASDDTLRYGQFFNIEKVTTSDDKIDYCLKVNPKIPTKFGADELPSELPNFNFSVNFKGTYFQNENFNVTLNFKFDLINHYQVPDPEKREEIEELVQLQTNESKLELDERGNQNEDFNFDFTYLLTSPKTGESTNIIVESSKIAAAGENASDDTLRYGRFFNVEKATTNEGKIDYRLKFNSAMIGEFNQAELPQFNLSINFKGTYFEQKPFSVTLNFKFDLINHYQVPDPEKREEIEELVQLQTNESKLELDEQGNQSEDFNFDFTYLLTSPKTEEPTKIVVESSTIAVAGENASDDTLRYGRFFNIEKVTTNEGRIDYRLKFNSAMIGEFNQAELPQFNLSINFKGTFFEEKPFSVALNFNFDLINHYQANVIQDLQDFIGESQRELGVIQDLNDVVPEQKAQELVKTQVFKTFLPLVNEVDLNVNLTNKQVQVVAKGDSQKFKGEVRLTYLPDKNPQLLPDVSLGVDLSVLPTDRLSFSQLDWTGKTQILKDELKKWYISQKGTEFADQYFQYFVIETSEINLETTSVIVAFTTPWPNLNQKFSARFTIPYTELTPAIPNDLFADKLLDMNPSVLDETILDLMLDKAQTTIADFSTNFTLENLNVIKQTVEIVAKELGQNQIYQPNARLLLNFNVEKTDLKTRFPSLEGYKFNASANGLYYMTQKIIALGKIATTIDLLILASHRGLFTLNNDFNDLNFDTTDPDKWALKLTPLGDAGRYLTGELNIRYTNPTPSGLDYPLAGITYETPGVYERIKLDAPFLVSTDSEIQSSYLRALNQIYSSNPFSKWMIIKNPEKIIDVKIPLGQLRGTWDYQLHGQDKVKSYLRPTTVTGKFDLAVLDLQSYFAGGIQINQPVEATTPETIGQELYDMIVGKKPSDFPAIKNLTGVVDVVDVIINGLSGTARLKVSDNYKYKNYVINDTTISFQLKSQSL